VQADIPKTPPPPTPSQIVIRATADAWIEVSTADVDADPLFSGVLKIGETYEVPNQPGLSLMTGNAGGLEILVDGDLAPTLGGMGQVRRDVSLDPERLQQGRAASP
jgi:cytoskeleton protein RodZ